MSCLFRLLTVCNVFVSIINLSINTVFLALNLMNFQLYFGTRNHRSIILIIFIALLAITKPTLAATYIVNTTDNTNDGKCNAEHCSLLEAITAANAFPNIDVIDFNIPGVGIHTIYVSSPLPDVTAPVLIDGTSQPGYSGSLW